MQTASYRKQLEELLSQLHEQIEKQKEGHPVHSEQRDMENTEEDDLTETEHGFRIHNILEDIKLKERMTVEALDRIEKGTYGKCLNCGKEIDKKRLDAIPFTRYCIECQIEIESHPEKIAPQEEENDEDLE